MTRIVISTLIIISSIFVGFSQTHIIPSLYEVPSPSERIDSLLSVINNRKKELEHIKKNKVRADSLAILVDDYVLLVGMWQDEYKQVKKMADKYRALECLLSESDSVFNIELPNIAIVPPSLRNHYNLISQVVSIQKEIERVEQEIADKTKACIAISQEPMAVIPKLISSDVDAIYTKIAKLKETGLPTFSAVQRKYFDDNIRGRYNNFERYFTNE
ncbi:hypothetical protein HQ36_02820 [Porphyromonas gingivicanis]|uniref:Uncharacterized protein n=1 Tax=Porphyromonas gingivicanis TaxID=266762 RepID=A0A0A2G7I5_9PORP|nr:hypothetical protein [Porphyromonas gingivicanis]KGN98362.1 hypothetical protein HQ36_02820 [Porphyromonas gingivicanis]